MKRKNYYIFFLICIFLSLTIGCTEKESEIDRLTSKIEVPSISEYRTIHGILQSSITNMDCDQIKAFEAEKKNIDNSMISARIHEILECNYDLTDSQESIICEGNAVTVDCIVEDSSGNKIYEDDGIVVLVGGGFFDSVIESALIGEKVNDTIKIEGKQLENTIFTDFSDVSVVVKIKKVEVYEEKEETSKFLQEQGFSSFHDFYKYLYEMKVNELEYEYYAEQSMLFYKTIMKNSKFNIVKEELEDYQDAVLQKNKSENFIFCTEEAEFEIKKMLAIEELSKQFSIYVEPEVYTKFCQTNNINENDEAGRIDAGYYCLLEKVTRYFIDKRAFDY